jgi:hypothetical protein
VTQTVSGFRSGWDQSRAIVTSTVEGIKGALAWFNGLGAMFTGWMTSVRTSVSSGLDAAVQFFRELPTRIKVALSNLGSLLLGIGRDAINGLVNWLKSFDLGRVFVQLFGSAVDAVKRFLGIHSPSRMFAEIGKFTILGVPQGMRQATPKVLATVTSIAGQISRAFDPDLSTDLGSTGTPVTGGTRTGGANVQVVNYYPQAEPTSVSINRGLQYTGMLGVI